MISVVIPVFNEEENLPELYSRLSAALAAEGEYEVVFVDDGSNDNTIGLLKEFRDKDNRVKVLKLSHNFGQQAALMAGFEFSRGEVVVTMDADLQNNPEDMPALLKGIAEGYEVVYSRRVKRKDPFLTRRLPSFFANWLISKVTKIRLHDYGCNFRAFSRERVKFILNFGETGMVSSVLGAIKARKIKEVEISHSERRHGQSKYSFFHLLNLATDIAVSHLTTPFRLIGLLGFSFFSVASVWSVYFIIKRFILQLIPEINSKILLLILIMLFMGLQLMILGFLGEYIIRIYQRLQKKPMYKVEYYLN